MGSLSTRSQPVDDKENDINTVDYEQLKKCDRKKNYQQLIISY